jgi:hypothetical protein
MPILTQQFLQTLGITLDEQTYASFAEHFETTLGDRVIDSIIDNLGDDQVEQLAAMRDQGDDELQAWLQANVPDLKEIVEDEVAILIGELAENSEQI